MSRVGLSLQQSMIAPRFLPCTLRISVGSLYGSGLSRRGSRFSLLSCQRTRKWRVGEFLDQAPLDLKDLGAVEFIHLDRSRAAYWETSIDEVVKSMDDLVAIVCT